MHRRVLWTKSDVNVLCPDDLQPCPTPPRPALRSCLRCEDMRLKHELCLAQHRDLLRDIDLNVPTIPPVPELPGPSPVIAAVRQHIEELAFLDRLRSEDATFKAKSLFGCAFLARETVLRETLRVFRGVTDP